MISTGARRGRPHESGGVPLRGRDGQRVLDVSSTGLGELLRRRQDACEAQPRHAIEEGQPTSPGTRDGARGAACAGLRLSAVYATQG